MRPSLRLAVFALSIVAAAPACGGAQSGMIRTPGCAPLEQTPRTVTLRVGQVATVPQPCPRQVEGSIRGPVRLTATRDGLRIQFGVDVAEYQPGPYRDEGPERDVVVVFPRDTGPGQPTHQLNTTAARGTGYVVDDVVPWTVWDLTEPQGGFRLTVAVFDRYGAGFQIETRFSVFVTVEPGS